MPYRRGSAPIGQTAAVTFWETFSATMAGALAGAIVGSLTAWLFSRNLAVRDREHRYRDLMNGQLARIIEALRELADEIDQAPLGLVTSDIGSRAAPPRYTALSKARAAVDAALTHARGRDYDVVLAIGGTFERLDRTQYPSSAIGGLIDALHAIRFFDPKDYDALIGAIEDFPYDVP